MPERVFDPGPDIDRLFSSEAIAFWLFLAGSCGFMAATSASCFAEISSLSDMVEGDETTFAVLDGLAGNCGGRVSLEGYHGKQCAPFEFPFAQQLLSRKTFSLVLSQHSLYLDINIDEFDIIVRE